MNLKPEPTPEQVACTFWVALGALALVAIALTLTTIAAGVADHTTKISDTSRDCFAQTHTANWDTCLPEGDTP